MKENKNNSRNKIKNNLKGTLAVFLGIRLVFGFLILFPIDPFFLARIIMWIFYLVGFIDILSKNLDFNILGSAFAMLAGIIDINMGLFIANYTLIYVLASQSSNAFIQTYYFYFFAFLVDAFLVGYGLANMIYIIILNISTNPSDSLASIAKNNMINTIEPVGNIPAIINNSLPRNGSSIFCSQCGNPINENMKYCPQCGAKLQAV